MATIFTAKNDLGYLYALILTSNSHKASEMHGFDDLNELKAEVRKQYEGAEFVPSRKFQSELEQRQVHSPELIALLKRDGELLGLDLTSYVVYGAPMRPMSRIWARIENAVFVQADKSTTGYHTYVAVPDRLDSDTISQYELVFVSRGL